MADPRAPFSLFKWVLLTLGLVIVALTGFGWWRHVSSEGHVVASNVLLAGSPIGGLTRAQLDDAMTTRASSLASGELVISFGDKQISLPYGALGFAYDEVATTRSALLARHQGPIWKRFSSWVIGPFVTEEIEEVWRFDPEQARNTLEDHPGFTPVLVEEPVVAFGGVDGMVMTPGVVGTEADRDDIIDKLGAIDLTRASDRVSGEAVEIRPTVTDQQASQVADRLNSDTSEGARVLVGDRSAFLTPWALRSTLVVDIVDGEVEPQFDPDLLQETLERTVTGHVGDFLKPVIEVDGDHIEVVTVGEVPPLCCREGAGELLGQAIMSGRTGPFILVSRPDDAPRLNTWADGSLVVEKVGEFTTPHACCENRVRNIQRMADMVRGFYLLPFETLSLNQLIGPRTRANGFVSAGAIRQGHMILEVGGGVSQFATTIFNAAYFAGLDIDTYQSHSVYFSRYPYGREATISNPAPDLVMTNATDHPVLIWTSYTPNSITVTMYSTRNVEVVELGQRTTRRGLCRHVETDRQRTFSSGRVVIDIFVANYRPGEGLDCSGNPLPRPVS
ncbi:MAG TPA: VanW family protein [Acidimicrobiia bacterium]